MKKQNAEELKKKHELSPPKNVNNNYEPDGQ